MGRTLDAVPITHGGTAGPRAQGDADALGRALAQVLGGPPPEQAEVADDDCTLFGRIEKVAYGRRTPTVPRHFIDGDAAREPGMPVVELRQVVLNRNTPMQARHRVWTHIGRQIHQHRGAQRADWFLYALGLILPGLWDKALELAPPPDTPLATVHRVHCELAEEFLFALHRFDPDQPYLWNRCLSAAVYQAKGGAAARRRARAARKAKAAAAGGDTAAVVRPEPAEVLVGLELAGWGAAHAPSDRLRRPPDGHEYLVLAELVRGTAHLPAGRRLSRDDARLLAYTYVDGYTLAEAARIEGIAEATARGRQWRARQLIAQLLGRRTGDP